MATSSSAPPRGYRCPQPSRRTCLQTRATVCRHLNTLTQVGHKYHTCAGPLPSLPAHLVEHVRHRVQRLRQHGAAAADGVHPQLGAEDEHVDDDGCMGPEMAWVAEGRGLPCTSPPQRCGLVLANGLTVQSRSQHVSSTAGLSKQGTASALGRTLRYQPLPRHAVPPSSLPSVATSRQPATHNLCCTCHAHLRPSPPQPPPTNVEGVQLVLVALGRAALRGPHTQALQARGGRAAAAPASTIASAARCTAAGAVVVVAAAARCVPPCVLVHGPPVPRRRRPAVAGGMAREAPAAGALGEAAGSCCPRGRSARAG